jgi:hypothetical protein
VQAARAAAARAEAEAAEDEAMMQPEAAYIGRTTARSAAAAAQAAEAAAAAAAAGEDQKPEGRSRDRDRSRRRRDANDSDDDTAEPNVAIPFADDEVDEAPATGISVVEPISEFGRVVHPQPPVWQPRGYAGKASLRDPASANKRKRRYGNRPIKQPNVPTSNNQGTTGTDADTAMPPVGGIGAVSGASAMSQRRKYILRLSEARSIGKRPAPQFTNYLYFKMQAARMQPMERLPRRQVVQAGRQAGRVAIIGMMYPRLTTSSEAIARLALAPLKWRGLLENCVSSAQACPSLCSPYAFARPLDRRCMPTCVEQHVEWCGEQVWG